MNSHMVKKASCIITAAMLLSGLSIPASAAQQAAVSGVEETVYGNLHPDGTISLNTVYKMTVESAGDYTIYGNFSSAKNLTANVDCALDEDGVKISFPGEYEAFYFQAGSPSASGGDGAAAEFPFIIDYHIERNDGTKAAPTAGDSGHMKLAVDVKANDKAAQYFRSGYMAQVQIPINADVFKNIKTDLSGVLSGNTYTFSGMVLPGMSDTFVIEGDVKSLELDSISVTMLDYDLSGLMSDTDMLSGIDEMSGGAKDLADGTHRLADGMEALAVGMGELSSAGRSAKNGAAGLEVGMASFEEGFGELAEGSAGLTKGASDLAGGTKLLDSQGAALLDGFSQIKQGLSGMSSQNSISQLSEELRGIATAIQGSPTMSSLEKQQILAAMAKITEALPSSGNDSGLGSVTSQLDEYEKGLKAYVGGVSSLSAGASALSDGTKRYVSGVDALKNNFTKLTVGAYQLRKGLAELSAGLDKVSDQVSPIPAEVSKLADGQQSLYEGIGQFQTAVNDFTGNGNTKSAVVSAMSPNNKVDAVQFILRTDAVKPAKRAKEQPKNSESESFLDRLLDLFR